MSPRRHHPYWPPREGWAFDPRQPGSAPAGFWEGTVRLPWAAELDFSRPSVVVTGWFLGWGDQDRWRVQMPDGPLVEGAFHMLFVDEEKVGHRPYWHRPILGGMKKGMAVRVTFQDGQPRTASVQEDRIDRVVASLARVGWALGWRPCGFPRARSPH